MTIIYRHRRENLKKCSLSGLEKKKGFRFFTYPQDRLPDVTGCILLKMGAPPLTKEDKNRELLLIDGTWRLAQIMENQIPQEVKRSLVERSLPNNFRTAYPRRQTECPDPESGLSSLEALYVASFILELPLDGMLDHYYWKQQFLDLNQHLLC